jgi:hypothetical protein
LGPRREGRTLPSITGVDLIAEAKPWTYWIAPVLTLSAVLAVLGAVVGYLIRVVAARYPKQ